MGFVNSTVTLYKGVIDNLVEAQIQALEMTAEAVHTDVVQAQVMPRRTGQGGGTLQNTATSVNNSKASRGVASLVSNTPYARRMYFHPEYNFSKVENPNAQGKWYEPWLTGDKKDFAQNAFSKFYKKLTGV